MSLHKEIKWAKTRTDKWDGKENWKSKENIPHVFHLPCECLTFK